MKADNLEVNVMVKLSLWNALKLRLAGIANVMEKDRQQEAEKLPDIGDIRINKHTKRLEICIFVERSTKKPYRIIDEEWADCDAHLLDYTLGVCPQCGGLYSLIRFKQKAEEEAKKVKEEDHNHGHSNKVGSHNHGHSNKVGRGDASTWVDVRCKEAEEAGIDPALLF